MRLNVQDDYDKIIGRNDRPKETMEEAAAG